MGHNPKMYISQQRPINPEITVNQTISHKILQNIFENQQRKESELDHRAAFLETGINKNR